MTLVVVFALAVYVLIGTVIGVRVMALAAWRFHLVDRRKFSALYNEGRYSSGPPAPLGPSGEQWFGGALCGLTVAPFWPLVLIAFAFRSQLFAPPKDVREMQQAQRIRELEDELDLRR